MTALPPAINPIPRALLAPPKPDVIDFKHQAFEVPGTRKEGQTGHYRNVLYPDQNVLIQSPKPQTLYELVRQVTSEIPNDNALGYLPVISPKDERPLRFAEEYSWITYGEVEHTRMEIGSALMHLYRTGVIGEPERIDPSMGEAGWGVGIWSGNRPEWQMTDMATQAFSLVSMALYDTLGPDSAKYVCNHSQLAVIFCSIAHLPGMLGLLPECKSVKAVVCMDPLVEGSGERELAFKWAKQANVWIGDWQEMRKIGRANPSPPILPRTDTIATLSYTSGTTGNPKGVVLTHQAMVTGVITNAFGSKLPERGGIVASYLPLSHIYARFLDLLAVYLRGAAAYSTGDTLRLLQDIGIMKPHLFASVPRVLNRIYAAIMAQANAGGIKGNLLNRAINTKLANFRATGTNTHAVYDRLVFAKLRGLLGGRVQYMGTGSAPISPTVFETLKVCFGCEMVEGWGMTETVGTGARGYTADPGSTGTIGAPQVCNDFKLVDIPEMGYLSTDKPHPRGELCARGYNIFSGYYKDEKNTKEALDSEGWLHTGDVCSVDEAGRFKIIDRKKNLLKLSQGEYVAVETVEGIYGLCPLFSSFYLHGDGLKNHLVGIAVLDSVQTLLHINKNLHHKLPNVKTEADLRELTTNPHDGSRSVEAKVLRKEIVKLLKKLGKERKLHGYEMVKGIHLTVDPFSPDLLTPTFKYKRNVVGAFYSQELAKAYEESEEPEDPQESFVKSKL